MAAENVIRYVASKAIDQDASEKLRTAISEAGDDLGDAIDCTGSARNRLR